MNLHALAFLGLFLLFAGLTLRRSSWGIPLYAMTMYACPAAWWWGEGALASIGTRWNLTAALILALGIVLDGRPQSREAGDSSRTLILWMLVYALNASLVHLLLADNPELSWEGLVQLWKQVGLLFLLLGALKDRFDLKLMIYTVVLGAAFVGYEVVFNGFGGYKDGRLELSLVFASGNQVTALFALALPLGGYLVFCGKRLEKCVAVVSLVLILETILRVNSRGIFLGMIGAAVCLVVRSKGRLRKYAIAGVVLGVLSAFAQMGEYDQSMVLGRFETTFAPAEKRDSSEQSRLVFWRQGVVMIGDHPLGSGHQAAFKSDLGFSYIRPFGQTRYRAVHNGFLDTAASWGVQGLILFLAAVLFTWRRLRSAIVLLHASDNEGATFLGCCLEAILVLELIACFFTSTLDAEWFLWWMGLSLAYSHVVLAPSTAEEEAEERAVAPAYLPEPSCVALTRKSS